MEQPSSHVLCPVCSLYLREGISLKSHLQTHSKEKVIEALLNKQNVSIEDLEDSDTSTSPPTTASTASEPHFGSVGKTPVSVLPSTYIQPSAYQQSQTSPNVNNNVHYIPAVNNSVLPQPVFGNPCNTNITYHPFMTNEGNIIIIPTYNPQPSIMVSNNVLSTPVLNSCVMVPPAASGGVDAVVVDSPPSPPPMQKADTPKACIPLLHQDDETSSNSCEIISPCVEEEENEDANAVAEDEDEKDNDAEVAGIFDDMPQKMCEKEAQTATDSSKLSQLIASDDEGEEEEEEEVGDEDDKMSCASFDDLRTLDHDGYSSSPQFSSDFAADDETLPKLSVSPADSLVKLQNELNYESDNSSYLVDDDLHECAMMNCVKTDVDSVADPNSKSEPVDMENTKVPEYARNDRVMRESMSLPVGGNHFNFIESNSDNATHILPDSPDESMVGSKMEKDQYILPTNDIPSTSSSDYNFIGIRNSFLSSASLISSVNKTMFADVHEYAVQKTEQDVFDPKTKVEDSISLYQKEDYAKLEEVGEKRKENMYKNFNDTLDSAGSSRLSPFNIQTDESMPARGELSGQESLSGTENSIWELQVKNNANLERYDVSCKAENGDVKINLHSLIKKVNVALDPENVSDEIMKTTVQKIAKTKVTREFRYFYCKAKFDSWKLRQSHIGEEHADEDSLTTEFLFSKRIKCKLENDDEDAAATQADSLICRICHGTSENSVDFLQHLKNVHGIKKRNCVCPTCLVHFNTLDEYQEHIQKVHPYECMTCGKKFHTKPGYMLHQKRHMKVKPYGCDVCDKSFVTKQKLTEHMNIHTGANPIKCDMCDSNFKRYSNYQQHKKYLHLNTKRKLKDFICECGEVFHSKVKLIWHREIHDDKPKQCPFCVERFVHTASLTRHVRKWHNETYLSDLVNKKKIRNVTCPVCNITYLHTSLQTHMKIHEGVKPFACGECSKTFRTKWNLQLHRWTHMSRSAKPYKCKLCVKAYVHKTDYEAHLRSHSNCRPYSCNICGRQFIRKYNCIRHIREHKEPRTYKCNICGKMFSRSYYLTEHRKTHTGEKPHTCHICGKASATKSNHNKHVKMHNNIRESVNSEG